jgi:proteasome lid subunit RPN8/RPN11
MSPDDPTPTKTDPIEIPTEILEAMIAHCVSEAPLEACGVLAGVAPRVRSSYTLRNAAKSENRYYADEGQLITAVRAIREGGEEILALYHSHPRWEPTPSKTDLRENYWGTVPRIIVGLLGVEPDVRIWKLDGESFEELPWRVVDL